MNGFEYLALALELWTVMGVLGLSVSLIRRERQKLWKGAGALVGAWAVYLTVLLVVSARQPERRIPMGQPLCFHQLCFAVERVEDLPGFPIRNNERLVRVSVRVTNAGKNEAQESLRGTLVDAQGRRWKASNAVSGNPLGARVLAGGSMVSEPVFRVALDSTGLGLELTHGRRWRQAVVIGDPESFGHRGSVMVLDR